MGRHYLYDERSSFHSCKLDPALAGASFGIAGSTFAQTCRTISVTAEVVIWSY
jgi:hypothetical protein